MYLIRWTEENVYWVTRVIDTDNYTEDETEATLFPDKTAAYALLRTLDIMEDHDVIEYSKV